MGFVGGLFGERGVILGERNIERESSSRDEGMEGCWGRCLPRRVGMVNVMRRPDSRGKHRVTVGPQG